jgi:hypothetical protein
MARKARTTPPRADHTGPTRKRARRPLQRRLRQIASRVEWTDVFAAVAVQTALDALGGGEPALGAVRALLRLLGIDT